MINPVRCLLLSNGLRQVNYYRKMASNGVNRIHGGNIWPYIKAAKNMIIDFSANVNPLGLPTYAKEIILKNTDNIPCYPEPEAKDLKQALGIYHNINPNNLLVGNGSIEFIHLIPRVLKARHALIIIPTFSEYEFALKINKTKITFLKTTESDNFKIDIIKIKKIIPKVDLVFLCNPNNPTGWLLLSDEISAILKFCKKYKAVLLIDEVFMDFVKNCEKITLIADAIRSNYVLILRSLTKFFALAGLRLGYLIGGYNLIKQISRFQYPWNVNVLAQSVGRQIIKDKDYIRNSKEFVFKEREYLFENLKEIKGLKVYLPTANFVFCKLENGKIQSAKDLSEKLFKKGILIRDCRNFRGLNDRFFRLAVRTRDENNFLISNLKKIL